MGRDIKSTIEYIEFAQELRRTGTFVGTNIIIDYRAGDKTIHNCDRTWLDKHFDYWAWNPYFDGEWDKTRAEERMKLYIR